MSEANNNDLCAEVDEAMAELLDGSASEELFDHVADCDRCRDARHDAESAAEVVSDSAADYVHPDDFASRVLAALDAGESREAQSEPPPAPIAETVAETVVDEESLPLAGKDGASSTLAMDVGDERLALDETAKAASVEAAPVSQPAKKPASSKVTPSKVTSLSQRLRKPRNTIAVGLVGAAAAAAAVGLLYAPTDLEQHGPTADAPWTGKVVRVARAAGGEGGLSVCNAEGAACQPAAVDGVIAAGAVLKTDDRTRAFVALEDGTRLALDRSTELSLSATANRTAKLMTGAIVAEVAKVEGTAAHVDLPMGRVDVIGTKFALRTMGDAAAVDVTRGAVMLVDDKERSVKVRAGEEGRVYPGVAPYASAASGLDKAVSWSENDEGEEVAIRGLGELKGKKPGSDDEATGAVELTAHNVKVRIVDGFARTEIEETFTNKTNDVLEGIYRFPLPPDAQIERLALDVPGDKFEEGAFVDRDRAAAIWRGAIRNAGPKKKPVVEEIIWVPGPWKDPALLEWQRGGRFELRVFPIPKNGSRKIILTYTQAIQQTEGVRRYIYPLAHDATGELTVDEFNVDVEVRGHDQSFGITTQGYGLARTSANAADKLTLHAQSFVSTGDLVVEYATANREAELSAWAYQPKKQDELKAAEDAKPKSAAVPSLARHDDANVEAAALAAVNDTRPYVAIALRPKLPRASEDAQRAYVMIVDASRSMYGERFKRAGALAARMAGELDRQDRFTVLACDTSCRAMPGGLIEPSSAAAALVEQFLSGVTPEGGSDPTAAMRDAGAFASEAGGRALRVVYIGDGTPTVGPIRPAYVTAAVRDALPQGTASVTAVAIGADSDLDALGALARGGGGVVLPYVPGQKVGEATYAVLGATYGQTLRDVRVELPAGLVEVAPHQLDTIPAGGESFVLARMRQPSVDGKVVLRGRVGTEDYEQTFPLSVSATESDGNAFVPRLYAAAKITDLEREGTAVARAKAVALSGAFNVASRYTSLLVLESPAMFKAFGLDNKRRVALWTGEQGVSGASSSGDKKLDRPDADGEAESKDDGWADDDFFDAEKSKKSERSADGSASPGGGLRGSTQSAAKRPAPAPAPRSRPRPEATPTPKPSPPPQMSSGDPMGPSPNADPRDPFSSPRTSSPARPWRDRRMVPMRKVFERQANIFPGRLVPSVASSEKILAAEAELAKNDNRRDALKELLSLYMLAGDIERASELAERWAEKEALDPEALTARADVMASRGLRDDAIRLLGSVVDVRPGDVASQQRLARLHRWAGRQALGCRHHIAVAQLHESDPKLLSEAVFCGRHTGEAKLAESMLAGADEKVRARAETLLKDKKEIDGLRGEIRLTATWSGGQDLDLALIHPDGHRVSWLGAPTKGLITAENVTSTSTEGLALLGSEAGEYSIEVVRGSGEGPVSGEVLVRAAGVTRKIPFTLQSQRAVIGTMNVFWKSRLVPVQGFVGGGSVGTRPPPPRPPPIDCGLRPFFTNAQGHRQLRPECLK